MTDQNKITVTLKDGFSFLHKGETEVALTYFLRALYSEPGNPEATNGAGSCYVLQGKEQQAVDLLEKCIGLGKGTPDVSMNLARLQCKRPSTQEAAVSTVCNQLALTPHNPELFCLLAEIEGGRGNLDKALKALTSASKLDPNNYEIHSEISLLSIVVGDAESGISHLMHATSLAPCEPKLRYYQAKAAFLLNDNEQALEGFKDYQLRAKPEDSPGDVASMMGLCYLRTGDLDQSILYFEQALLRNPLDANALINAYNAYRSAGEIAVSIQCCDKVLTLEHLSKYEKAKSFYNLMFTYSTMGCSVLATAKQVATDYWLRQGISQELSKCYPIEKERTKKRIKIGILSSEIGNHVVSFFLEPILANYPKDLVDIDLLVGSYRYEEDTDRLIGYASNLLCLSGLPAGEAQDLIAGRGYDVILETSGYTSDSNIAILSQRCAPVQCHYIGYHATTFMPTMDYFIGDSEFIPPSIEYQFTEKILRIEGPWITRYVPSNLPLAKFRGDQSKFVMASTNQTAKISEDTLMYWAQALLSIDQSILIIKNGFAQSSRVKDRVLSFFGERLIDKDRIYFQGGTPSWQAYMDFYNTVDVVLDSTPWSAATTAFDVISMGTPFVAIRGNVAASRMSSSILKAAKLDHYIADSHDEFCSIVSEIGKAKSAYRQIRQMSQEKNLRSNAFDQASVANRVIEALINVVKN